MNHPTSYRRQDWASILFIGITVWLAAFVGLLVLTWPWLTPWPDLSVHIRHWLNGLSGVVFDHSLSLWLSYWQALVNRNWHWALLAHVILSALLASLLAFFVARRYYVSGGTDGYRHISGPRLHQDRTALVHAKQAAKLEAGQPGLRLHPKLQISKTRESGNIFVVGNQGTGKTVFIAPLIGQVIDRGERAFIYDEKREFTALFYTEKSTVLLAPWDKRGMAWDIQRDAHNATQAQLIAERLISDSRDPLWSNGARMLFTGMMEILNHTQPRWGWRELAAILSLNEAALQSQLQAHYPRASRFIVEGSKTTMSFFAQLIGSLGWVYTLSDAWPKAYEGGFCMRDWVSNPDCNKSTDKPVIIVQADKRYKDIGAPLANTLIALMTSHILAQANSSTRELWLFIDELGNLPKNPALAEWMSLGRSKGCRICGGTQSISQLKHIYGEQEADTLLNMFTLFTSMRVGAAGETASYTAKVFGERVVERPTSSAGQGSGTTQNWHRETLPLVSASNLVHLPQPSKQGVVGYLLIPGYKAVYRLRWPYARLPVIADEHCPADWLTAKPASVDTLEPTGKSSDKPSRREQIKQRRDAA